MTLPASAVLTGQDWPQWRGAKRDGVWRETGIVDRFEKLEIAVKWRVPISNGYSGPTVANGRVYVMDRVTDPTQQERVHCFDAEKGTKLWSHTYDCIYKGVSYPNGPRAAVTVEEGKAYSYGTMANLYCFDAASGNVLWSKDIYTEYKVRMPDWGIAAAPIIEGDLLIVMASGENACLIAFDKKTGKERWKALPDRATYSAPTIIDQAGKRVLVCWTADRLVGLDPQSGKLYWEHPWPSEQNVDGITTPTPYKDNLFITSVYEGSLMLRLKQDKPAVEKVWARKAEKPKLGDGLHTMFATPVLKDDHLYGINYFGELRCLDAKTGDTVWEDTTVIPKAMWASAHLIQHGDKVWIFNERGQLIIAELSPKGYKEISRAQLISPTRGQLNQRGGVAWSHPAFAYQHVFARNDEELICASLKAGG
jgi:outer membrane protein assembly factor BamB